LVNCMQTQAEPSTESLNGCQIPLKGVSSGKTCSFCLCAIQCSNSRGPCPNPCPKGSECCQHQVGAVNATRYAVCCLSHVFLPLLQHVAEEFFFLASHEHHTRLLQQLEASMQQSMSVIRLSKSMLAASYGLDPHTAGRVQVGGWPHMCHTSGFLMPVAFTCECHMQMKVSESAAVSTPSVTLSHNT